MFNLVVCFIKFGLLIYLLFYILLNAGKPGPDVVKPPADGPDDFSDDDLPLADLGHLALRLLLHLGHLLLHLRLRALQFQQLRRCHAYLLLHEQLRRRYGAT